MTWVVVAFSIVSGPDANLMNTQLSKAKLKSSASAKKGNCNFKHYSCKPYPPPSGTYSRSPCD